MKIAVFIEPTANPDPASSQLKWAEILEDAVAPLGGSVSVLSSYGVCHKWVTTTPLGRPIRDCHIIELNDAIGDFSYSFTEYSLAAFGQEVRPKLRQTLEVFDARYRPDLVVMCGNNRMVEAALPNAKFLFLEQAPLPRIGHPLRLVFDTMGHRVGSMLEQLKDRILSAAVDDFESELGRWVFHDWEVHLCCDPDYQRIRSFFDNLKRKSKVAIFAMQPVANIPCEDGYAAVDMRELIARWSSQLPSGWTGVVTYHYGQRLSPGEEQLLRSSFKNLYFLDQDLSVDKTEAIILNADALVTISSSTALFAILLGKPAVVLGASPFRNWGNSHVESLDAVEPLSLAERIRLLKFLCGPYCLSEAEYTDAEKLIEIVTSAVQGNWAELCLDGRLEYGKISSLFAGTEDRTSGIEALLAKKAALAADFQIADDS